MHPDAQVDSLALSSLPSVSDPGNPGALLLHGCMLDPLLQLTLSLGNYPIDGVLLDKYVTVVYECYLSSWLTPLVQDQISFKTLRRILHWLWP